MPTVWLPLLLLLPAGDMTPAHTRLDNGLRVVVVEDRTLPLVSVQLWYGVGSAADATTQTGLCHVARAVVENRADAALRLRASGVRFDSQTLPDACYFASVLPPNLLEHVLAIEAERMRPRPAEKDALATALHAAARTYGLAVDQEGLANRRRLLVATFRDHPYGQLPGLVVDALARVTPADMNEFLERWFVAGNATLLIVGDVQTPAVQELVRKHFAGLPWAEAPRGADRALPAAEIVRLAPALSEMPGIDVAWALPRMSTFEQLALDVLMQRLCNPIDGPLQKRLLEEGFTPPRWRHEVWRDAGLLTCAADWYGFDPNAPRAAPDFERIVRDALQAAAGTPATEVELNRARALAGRELVQRGRAFSERALAYGRYEVVGGDLLLVAFEQGAVARVNVDDVRQAAAALLGARMALRPRTPMEIGVTSQPTTAPAPLAPLLAAERAQPLAGGEALELLQRYAPRVAPVRPPAGPGTLSTETLDNGVRVTVYTLPGAGPTVVRTLIDGPFSMKWPLATVVAAGSEKRDIDAYREYLSYHGLDLFPITWMCAGLSSRGPAVKVPQMVELQADLIRKPDLSEAARDSAFQRLFAVLGLREGWPPDFVEEEYPLAAGLTGWHPDALFTPLVPEEVTQMLRGLARVDDVEVLVVGDVPPADAVAAVRACWSDWSAPAPRPKPAPPASYPADDAPLTMIGWGTSDIGPATLLVGDEFWPTETERSLRDLALSWAGWTVAAPLHRGVALDAARDWRWHWFLVEANWLTYRTLPTPEDPVTALVRGLLERIKQWQHGELRPDDGATALYQARVDRLLAIESTDDIADRLQRGMRDPWDLHAALTPAEIARVAAEIYNIQRRTIGGEGPTDRVSELEPFDSLRRPTTPSSQPQSPL